MPSRNPRGGPRARPLVEHSEGGLTDQKHLDKGGMPIFASMCTPTSSPSLGVCRGPSDCGTGP
eukprot:6682374-Pyramimonas_sp.AAC.1